MTFLNLPYYDILINLNFYQDTLEARRDQLTQCNETIDENNMFLNIVGGKQRNAVYGLGSQASEYYGTSNASTSTTSPSPQQNEEEMQELRHKLTHQEEVINKLESLTAHLLQPRMKISVLTDISVFGFYGYIEDISVFITYSRFKDIFILYIKISLKVYEMIILIIFEKNIKIHFL